MNAERTNRGKDGSGGRSRAGIWDILVAEDDTEIDPEELA